MSHKTRLVPAGTFALVHTTPKAKPEPVLALPMRFIGGRISKSGHLNAMCRSLEIYGCRVNPIKAGTTAGDREIVSRRNISTFSRA